jgi:hypothetical protein
MHDATNRDEHEDTTRTDSGDGDRGVRAMSGEAIGPAPDEAPMEPRRRFRRRSDQDTALAGDAEAFAAVRAELLLLREENARLKAAQHQRADVSRLIGRARSLAAAEPDRDSISDDVEQLLVEGLLIRESLLEICQEVERSMVAFEGKLNALVAVKSSRSRPPADRDEAEIEQGDGYGSSVR